MISNSHPPLLDRITEGTDVHYVPTAGEPGYNRRDQFGRLANVPAKIVRLWSYGPENATANLMLFCDFNNDGVPGGVAWCTSRTYSSVGEEGTWHLPEESVSLADAYNEAMALFGTPQEVVEAQGAIWNPGVQS